MPVAMAIDVYDDLPPSPTLTNPDMILPASSRNRDSILFRGAIGANASNASLPNYAFSQFDGSYNNGDTFAPQYQGPGSAPKAISIASYQNPPISPAPTSPSILVRPSSPNNGTDTTPKRGQPGYANGPLASSPTLLQAEDWPLKTRRRLSGMSNTSSSVHSEDLGWVTKRAADAESRAEDEDDGYDRYPRSPDLFEDGEGGDIGWLNGKRDDPDDDFLSRRAEIILANAKKRLNMMEGNLKGARYSLSSNSLSNRFSYSSTKARQSIIDKTRNSTNHARSTSEVSLPSPMPSLPVFPKTTALPQRSSSALGSFAGGLSVLNHKSLRGVRSQEAMRESRLQNWIMESNTANLATPRAVSSLDLHTSPFHHFSPSLDSNRPVSQASSIRAQMDQLKGRISVIRERAMESTKRTSAIVDRTPSPGGYDPPYLDVSGSPIASLGTKRSGSSSGSPNSSSPNSRRRFVRDVTPVLESTDEAAEYEESNYEDAEETLDDLESSTLQNDGLGIYAPVDDDYEESVSGATEFFETDSVAERHEDRADAFDYENFFLHSAMGTYSRDRARRGSYSSDSSVETTRPASPLRKPDAEPESPSEADTPKRPSPLVGLHERNMSTASVSTVATFQTATEGNSDSEDDAEEELNAIAMPMVAALSSIPGKLTIPTVPSTRGSVIVSSPPPMPSLQGPPSPTRPSSTVLSSLIDTESDPLSSHDRDLVSSVAMALQQYCHGLQQASTEDKEAWRERLVEVNRFLTEGTEPEAEEEDDGDASPTSVMF